MICLSSKLKLAYLCLCQLYLEVQGIADKRKKKNKTSSIIGGGFLYVCLCVHRCVLVSRRLKG